MPRERERERERAGPNAGTCRKYSEKRGSIFLCCHYQRKSKVMTSQTTSW